jgi:uncharacterized delta-60 repeat protein
VHDAALQADGKILVAAREYDGANGHNYRILLLRYTPDGKLDTTFSGDGKFTYDVPGFEYSSHANAIEVLDDGRIVLGASGGAPSPNDPEGKWSFIVLRLSPEGALDTTFGGGDGVVHDELAANSFSADLRGLRVRADGSILAVGTHYRGHPSAVGSFREAAFASYSADGVYQGAEFFDIAGLAIDHGNVAFASDSIVYVGNYDTYVWRYDLAADTYRRFSMNAGEYIGGVLPQPDGSLVVAGRYYSATNTIPQGMMLVRFHADGTRDMSVGGGGAGRLIVNSGQMNHIAHAVQLPGHDRAVLLGGTLSGNYTLGRFVIGSGAQILNVAPTIAVTAPAMTQVNAPVAITFAATDPGDDTISGWRVNWGDGVIEDLPAAAAGASHTYVHAGNKSVVVSAIDEDGVHAAPAKTVGVQPAWAIVDRTLTVTGTDANESVTLSGDLSVNWAGTNFSVPGDSFDRVVVDTRGGGDLLTVNGNVTKAVRFEGGDGSDSAQMTGTPADEEITVTGDAVRIRAAGSADARVLELAAIESLVVNGRGGANAWSVDTGPVLMSIMLQGPEGTNVFDIISAPAVPPAAPSGYHSLRLSGGYGHDLATVRPGAGGAIFFDPYSQMPNLPVDVLTFMSGDGDDVIVHGTLSVISDGRTTVSFTALPALVIDGGGGNDRLEMTGALPYHPVTFKGGPGVDSFNFITMPSTNAVTNTFGIGANTVRWASRTFTHEALEAGVVTGTVAGESVTIEQTPAIDFAYHGMLGVDTLKVAAGAAYVLSSAASVNMNNLAVDVAAGGDLRFDATQRLRSLTVAGSASLAPGGDRPLITRALSLTGTLDLADNDLLLDYTSASPIGAWNGSAYSGVTGMIARGHNYGAWDTPGLVTSMDAAKIGITTLAPIEAGEVLGIAGTQTAVWDGHTVDATTVIVKYTYTGDLNLDGLIDGADYGIIDNYVQFPGTRGYANGDFNFDGVIDGADYGLIDNAIQFQGEPL